MIEPIVKSIEVPCSQQTAFEVFVNDMPTWWPLDKRAMSMKDKQTAKELRVEAKLGGTIIEIGANDKQYHWGTFTGWDPFASVKMDFHMGMPKEMASLVEVTFTVIGPKRTRVELRQSNFEAFGDMAEMVYGGYTSGWVIIFEEAYKTACGK